MSTSSSVPVIPPSPKDLLRAIVRRGGNLKSNFIAAAKAALQEDPTLRAELENLSKART